MNTASCWCRMPNAASSSRDKPPIDVFLVGEMSAAAVLAQARIAQDLYGDRGRIVWFREAHT